jgi:phenylalanyl-tRNA synthetase alpha chain
MNEQDVQQAKDRIHAAKSHNDLEVLRLEYLGRKGSVSLMLANVGKLPQRERARAGAKANQARGEIEAALASRKAGLSGASAGGDQPIDLTAPVPAKYGHAHPVNQVTDELIKVFWQMGYNVVDGPEVESDWYNFEALNMPEAHPARAMQDTFYLEEGNLPRTHTSGVQVRYMESHEPPIRVISPGKVYRNEDEDTRHSWMFYQVEGLVVDKGITLADLKGTLLAMMQGALGADTQLRLRPSYFPYTEPSVEMDATCIICGGKGCKTCSGTGWLELGGAGMVHPDVLRRVNIDPEIYSGFAFGFGPDRIAMLKYGVADIREFWRPDLRFLRQL